MNFIAEHIGNIIVVIITMIIITILYFAAKGKYRKIAEQILLSLVTSAEIAFADKTGAFKFAYVAEKFYYQMPTIVQFLFSIEDVEQMIEDAVEAMKITIDNIQVKLGGDNHE